MVENAISALDDAGEFTESLTNLGKKHQPWSLTQEHFRVNPPFFGHYNIIHLYSCPLENILILL